MQGDFAALVTAIVAFIGLMITLIFTTGRIGRLTGTMEQSIAGQNAIIKELKDEVIKTRDIVTDLALVNARLTNQELQIAALLRRVEELAHGEGFVVPLQFPRHSPA